MSITLDMFSLATWIKNLQHSTREDGILEPWKNRIFIAPWLHVNMTAPGKNCITGPSNNRSGAYDAWLEVLQDEFMPVFTFERDCTHAML